MDCGQCGKPVCICDYSISKRENVMREENKFVPIEEVKNDIVEVPVTGSYEAVRFVKSQPTYEPAPPKHTRRQLLTQPFGFKGSIL